MRGALVKIPIVKAFQAAQHQNTRFFKIEQDREASKLEQNKGRERRSRVRSQQGSSLWGRGIVRTWSFSLSKEEMGSQLQIWAGITWTDFSFKMITMLKIQGLTQEKQLRNHVNYLVINLIECYLRMEIALCTWHLMDGETLKNGVPAAAWVCELPEGY